MDTKYINPFIESLHSVFTTMLSTQPERKAVRVGVATAVHPGRTLTSVVGISGGITGVIALVFPARTALGLAGKFLGSVYNEVNEEVTDAVSELANMVGGGAKSKFELNPPPELSLPSVVEGTDYRMRYPTKSMWLEIPYTSPCGDFTMELSIGTG